MTEIPKVPNGKNWLARSLVQVILILAVVVYVAVKENQGQSTNTRENERIARLEECIITLRPLPSEVAGMKVSIEGVKSTVDKIEKKLDSHIDK
jgi:hypothetical protein